MKGSHEGSTQRAKAIRSLDNCPATPPSVRRFSTDGRIVRWIGLLVLAWGIAVPQGQAQPGGEGVGYSATLFAAGGSGASLPFWLSANQYGAVDPVAPNAGLTLALQRPFQKDRLTYAFGAELVGRASAAPTAYASELYGRLRYGAAQLTVGRRKQMIGRVDPNLSLGSVTWSKNAPPVPKVTLSSDGYVPIPGTGNDVALKGHLAHGWFGRERFVRNALLHEKSLYLRAFSPDAPLQIHIGLVHHAQWGGTHPRQGEEPVSFATGSAPFWESRMFSTCAPTPTTSPPTT